MSITSNLVIKDYKEGLNQKQLSKKYHISKYIVKQILIKNDIKLKSKSELARKFSLDESFFEKIDTEEKAYILGLLYSDGNVEKCGNRIEIELRSYDEDILEKIKKILNTQSPLFYRNKLSNNKYTPFVAIRIYSKRLKEQLIKLGCMPNKSKILEFPTTEQVPKKFIWDFIRGIFDGDGSVYPDRTKKCLMYSIAGTENICKSIEKIVQKEFKIHTCVSKYQNLENLYTFRLRNTKKTDCASLMLNKLYKTAKIYLSRKYSRYLELLELEKLWKKENR